MVYSHIDVLAGRWYLLYYLRLMLTNQCPLLFPTSVQSEDAVVEAASLKRSSDNGDVKSGSSPGGGL